MKHWNCHIKTDGWLSTLSQNKLVTQSWKASLKIPRMYLDKVFMLIFFSSCQIEQHRALVIV